MINILANRYMIDEDWCYNTYKEYIKPGMKVLVIPFSFRDERIYSDETWEDHYGQDTGKYYHGIVYSFSRYNINNITWLDYFRDTRLSAKEKIQTADMLYFPGGLPDKMMQRLIEFDIVTDIEKHDFIFGFSAGALIQLKDYHLTPDADYNTFDYYKGMNIIKDFFVEVHYEGSKLQEESICRVLNEHKKTVYALADDGAIIVDNNKVISIGNVKVFE